MGGLRVTNCVWNAEVRDDMHVRNAKVPRNQLETGRVLPRIEPGKKLEHRGPARHWKGTRF